MESTIKAENRKYISYHFEVAVKVIDRSSTTLATFAFDVVEETILEESKQRRTRTMQQKERAARRCDANEIANN